MSTPDPAIETDAAGRTSAAGLRSAAREAEVHGVLGAADRSAAQDRLAASESGAAVPLTSLSSLLGGSFEAGAACAADGTCD